VDQHALTRDNLLIHLFINVYRTQAFRQRNPTRETRPLPSPTAPAAGLLPRIEPQEPRHAAKNKTEPP